MTDKIQEEEEELLKTASECSLGVSEENLWVHIEKMVAHMGVEPRGGGRTQKLPEGRDGLMVLAIPNCWQEREGNWGVKAGTKPKSWGRSMRL